MNVEQAFFSVAGYAWRSEVYQTGVRPAVREGAARVGTVELSVKYFKFRSFAWMHAPGSSLRWNDEADIGQTNAR